MVTALPRFPDGQRDERRQFFAARLEREGWPAHERDSLEALAVRICVHAPGTILVPPPGGPDVWTDRLVEAGKFDHPDDVRVVNGRPKQCHGNVSRKWLSQKQKRLRPVTGYCLDGDGLWRRHSWLVDAAGRITETTSRRIAYFGVVLDDDEADMFAVLNWA